MNDHSAVLAVPAADPQTAAEHFAARLSVETDPWDVHHDIETKIDGFVILDVRPAEDFARCHIAPAISFPYRTITAGSCSILPRDRVLVLYCWGPSCNAAVKAAIRLTRLGFQVKEMIGGIEYWCREGYPVEGDDPSAGLSPS